MRDENDVSAPSETARSTIPADALESLIAKLETATGPDILLDAAITAALRLGPNVDYYTSSIDAAVALAEKVLPGWSWTVARCDDDYGAEVDCSDFVSSRLGRGPTAALALCLAALRALQHSQPPARDPGGN